MDAKVAVAVIHGIGSQANKQPEVSDERTFSDRLYRRLVRRLGRRKMGRVAWREVFWADILGPRQDRYMDLIREDVRYDRIRSFLVKSIADAAAFQRRAGWSNELADAENANAMIEARVRATIADLNEDTSDDTPLVLLAHSFGGYILSNYVWDLQQGRFDLPTPFQRMETVSRLVTFGCNLPLFTFHRPPEEVVPIRFPGPALSEDETGEPWWLNFYDRDDVLGFPLAPIGPAYAALERTGQLADIPIDAGGLFRSWNPLSHEAYWTDRDFVAPVARVLRSLIEA